VGTTVNADLTNDSQISSIDAMIADDKYFDAPETIDIEALKKNPKGIASLQAK